MLSQAGYLPLVIRSDAHREVYLDALAEADGGHLEPLVDLFANIVSADLNDAITFVRSAHGRDVRAIALAAADAARRHVIQSEPGLRAVTDHYRQLAGLRLREVAGELGSAFHAAIPGLHSTQLAWIVPDAPEVPGRRSTRTLARADRPRSHGVRLRTGSEPLSPLGRVETAGRDAGRATLAHRRVVPSQGVAGRGDGGRPLPHDAGRFESSTPAADDRPVILGARRELTFSDSHPHDQRFLAWLEAALTTALEAWQAQI